MSPDETADLVFDRDVVPLLFAPPAISSAPELVLLAGAAGAGRRRGISRASLISPEVTVLSGDVLRTFLPALDMSGGRETGFASGSEETVARWLQRSLRFARKERRSIVVDGELAPPLAVAMARQFAGAGFETRLVGVASPPSKALLTVAALATDAWRSSRRAPTTSLRAHADEVAQTSAVMREAAAAFDRMVVVDDRGDVVFDGTDAVDAVAAFDTASRRVLTTLESAQWLGELRRTTEFVLDHPHPPRELVGLLVDAHQVAIRDVTPGLAVPRGSEVVTIEEHRLAVNLTALRRLSEGTTDAAARTVGVGVDRRRGPSR